jgi:hypothetical protein
MTLELIPMRENLTLAKGFIMHKMYHHGYVYARKPKHTPIENLQKGSPLDVRSQISDAISELMKDGLLRPKSTSHGQDLYAIESENGYGYANPYERKADLPLSKYGESVKPSFKIPPLTDEQIRKLKLKKK